MESQADQMTIRVRMDIEDIEELNVYCYDRGGTTRGNMTMYRRICGIVGLIFLGSVFFGQGWLNGAFGVVLLVVSFFMPVLWRMGIRYAVRNQKDQFADMGTQELTIRDDGLFASHDKGNAFFKWSGFRGLEITDTCAYLCLGPAQYMIIPRTKVIEGNWDDFVQSIKEHLNGGASE